MANTAVVAQTLGPVTGFAAVETGNGAFVRQTIGPITGFASVTTAPGTPSLRANFPSVPMVDPQTGYVTVAWQQFFLALYNRTGGPSGALTPPS